MPGRAEEAGTKSERGATGRRVCFASGAGGQRSHVGSPVNEWADVAVDAIAKDCNDPSQGDGVTPLVCAASEAFSLTDE
eukprot:1886691-Prymnesium_polylepis.1